MKLKRIKQEIETEKLSLRFTRYAWGKLVYVNELSTTEISGFCIASAKDLLLVEDIAFLQQVNTGASTLLNDEAVADHFDDQVDAGRKPNQFARIWLHTHPGAHFGKNTQRIRKIVGNDDFLIPSPSGVDEATISRVFGDCDWAVMFIYGGGATGYARLVLKKPVDGQIVMPVEMQRKGKDPTKKDFKKWKQEFEKNITEKKWNLPVVNVRVITNHYLQLVDLLDTDIDVDEFAQFIESFSETAGDFCQLNEPMRQWWMDEFRKNKKIQHGRFFDHRFMNPYC